MRQTQRVFSLFLLSPSSRRAWIEMIALLTSVGSPKVALLAEGVDRNLYVLVRVSMCTRRPPRGGRG